MSLRRDAPNSKESFFMFTFKQLRLALLRLFPEFRELEAEATTDPLTGLLNRRAFNKAFGRSWAFLSRSVLRRSLLANDRRKTPVISLIVIDIDHFKRLNDTYGHPAGDAVLTRLGKLIREHLGRREAIDIVARCGGEEFWVALPTASLDSAFEKARAFCQYVSGESFIIPTANQGGDVIQITVSCGIATVEVDDRADSRNEFDRLNAMADRALYAAKSNGRNRAVCFVSN